MCRQCIILGALFNAGASDSDIFPCETLARFDICLEERALGELMDRKAVGHLKDTIAMYSEFGVDLIPIEVTSDGSCLPHSVSRAMVGYEVFYDALRASLVQELQDNSEWYKENLPERRDPEARLDDESWAKEWQTYVDAARPTHGTHVGSNKHLHGVHILALANLLKRPILLLDSPEKMRAIESVSIDGCGMYLPLRHTREAIIRAHNRPLSPLVIAWQGGARNHYVAMAQRRGDIDSRMSTEEAQLSNLLNWVDFFHKALALPSAVKEALFALIEGNTASARDVTCRTVCKVLDNLRTYCTHPSEEHLKFCKLSLENQAVKHNLEGVSGALELLKSVGFGEQEAEGVSCLLFPTDIAEAQARRGSHGRLCELLGCFLDDSPICAIASEPHLPVGLLRGKVWVGLREVETEKDMERLFGPVPLMMKSWAEAVSLYGSGSVDSGTVWALNPGRNAMHVVSDMMERAKRSFDSLSQGEFGPQGWSHELRMSMESASTAARIQCPICRSQVQWPVDHELGVEQLEYQMNMDLRDGVYDRDIKMCPRCLYAGRSTFLSVKDTRYLRILQLLRQSFSDSARCWRCPDEKCGAANLDIDQRCILCRAQRPTGEPTGEPDGKRKSPDADSSPAPEPSAPAKRSNIGSGSGSSSGSSSSMEGSDWTCRSCMCPNLAINAVCNWCLARRGEAPFWESPLDFSTLMPMPPPLPTTELRDPVPAPGPDDAEEEAPAPGLHRFQTDGPRQQYAVVFHTRLRILPDPPCPPPASISDSPRCLSQPITSSEVAFAAGHISAATRDLGSMWRETRAALLTDDGTGSGGEEEGAGYTLSINLV